MNQKCSKTETPAMDMYAVMIPLVATEHGDALLLEVRSQMVRQPGEICFPGGRAEPGETAVCAAVRETCEELGLSQERIEVRSELAPLIMGDGRKVFPITARLHVEDIGELALSEEEVEEVFLLPLKWVKENPPVSFDLAETPDEELPTILLRYLSHYESYRKTGRTEYMEYEGHGIWGLTARIIASLAY